MMKRLGTLEQLEARQLMAADIATVWDDPSIVHVAKYCIADEPLPAQQIDDDLIIDDVRETGDNFGEALAKGDFNGDGYDDLAVGVPDENVQGHVEAGAVNIIYGTKDGLRTYDNQFWTQADLVGSQPGAYEHFGYALATGDFNYDQIDDLAIGTPWDDVDGVNAAGSVHVIYGSADGLRPDGNQLWNQNRNLRGESERSDQLGFALATGDFDNNGSDDLAIGVPGEGLNGKVRAGAVHVVYSEKWVGLTAGDQAWHQDLAIAGRAEDLDNFGYSLASGDFNVDGPDDLVVGVPYETHSGALNAGAVNVIYGKTGIGLHTDRNEAWHQGTPGMKGKPQPNDHFGWSLATGTFGTIGIDNKDLVVGIPGEDVNRQEDAGAAQVIYGTVGVGLTANGDKLWHQNQSGIAGDAQAGDRFGSSLTTGDLDGDRRDDLIVGVPGEDISNNMIREGGAANVIYGSFQGLSASRNEILHENLSVFRDKSESQDEFGSALVAGDFNGDGLDDVAIGVPGEDDPLDLSFVRDAGAVQVIDGFSSGLINSASSYWYQGKTRWD